MGLICRKLLLRLASKRTGQGKAAEQQCWKQLLLNWKLHIFDFAVSLSVFDSVLPAGVHNRGCLPGLQERGGRQHPQRPGGGSSPAQGKFHMELWQFSPDYFLFFHLAWGKYYHTYSETSINIQNSFHYTQDIWATLKTEIESNSPECGLSL